MRTEGLDQKDLLQLSMDDANKIKVILGIAGQGKSSATNEYFKLKGERYARFTSSNVLKRASMEKYSNECEVKTIASGLYNCVNRGWYREENERIIPFKTVVLDEVPQTDVAVFDWAIRHKGEHNIIMTFDEKQMLSPNSEALMRQTIYEFLNRDDVEVLRVDGSWRPWGPNREKTLETYYEFYNMVDDDEQFFAKDLEYMFKVCDFHDVEYKPENVYITHTNESEDYLYKWWHLDCNPDAPIIPKGSIASKDNAKITSYPILSQSKQEQMNAQSYFQIANVATPTRFQGSEVELGNKLYYFVNYDSMITARELYTVVTRVRDIDDLRVVFLKRHTDKYEPKTFMGLPIKYEKTLYIDFLSTLSDVKAKKAKASKEFLGYYLPEQISAGKMKQMIKLYGKQLKDNEVYQARYIMDNCGDVCYYVDADDLNLTDSELQQINSKKGRTKMSAKSAISHDGKYQYSYCAKIYEILNKHGVDNMRATRPLKVNDKHSNYYVDCFSAHVHILNFCEMPIDGVISTVYDENMMNWYLYHGDNFSPESLVEDELAQFITENGLGECEYVFSTPKDIGSNMGTRLYNKAHKSIEDKKEINEQLHWGYYEKPYMWVDGSTSEYAVVRKAYNHELLICAIYSKLTVYMYKLRKAFNSDKAIVTDACYFDELTNDTVDIINSILPKGVDYRIRQKYYDENGEIIYEEVDGKLKPYETVVYQTYDELKHRKTAEKAKQRANWSDEKKQLERDKAKARMAKLRAKRRMEVAKKGDK